MSDITGDLTAHLSRWVDGGSEGLTDDHELQTWEGGLLFLDEFVEDLAVRFAQLVREHITGAKTPPSELAREPLLLEGAYDSV